MHHRQPSLRASTDELDHEAAAQSARGHPQRRCLTTAGCSLGGETSAGAGLAYSSGRQNPLEQP